MFRRQVFRPPLIAINPSDGALLSQERRRLWQERKARMATLHRPRANGSNAERELRCLLLFYPICSRPPQRYPVSPMAQGWWSLGKRLVLVVACVLAST